MRVGTFFVAFCLWALVLASALVVTGQDVDPDVVCNGRLDGANWQGERVNTNYRNQSMRLRCENSRINETRNLTVDINVEVESNP